MQSMKVFAVASFLLLALLSTDMMNGPVAVNAQFLGRDSCNLYLCKKFCGLFGKPGCCAGLTGPCLCQSACPRVNDVRVEITEKIDFTKGESKSTLA